MLLTIKPSFQCLQDRINFVRKAGLSRGEHVIAKTGEDRCRNLTNHWNSYISLSQQNISLKKAGMKQK